MYFKILEKRSIEFFNQREQLNQKKTWNWITITPIQIEYDDDAWTGCIDFTLIVLWVGFRISYIKDEEAIEHLKEIAKEYDSESKEEYK